MTNLSRLTVLAVAVTSLGLTATKTMAAGVPGPLLYTVILPAGEFGSLAFSGVVVGGLASAQKFCAELDNPAYRVDCLAERYGALAKSIPQDSDYAEVQTALKSASDQLATLAKSNRDPKLPRGKATRKGSTETTTRPLTPVSAARAVEVNQQARVILDQTGTLLLRSAEGSKSKAAQYAQIAEAIDSNKVLLRSA